MKFAEMTLEQVQQAIKAGSPDDMRAFLAQEDIEIPEKAPWNLPPEIDKFGRKLWKTLMITPVEVCAADEHDFQSSGNCEMERNSATMPGSAFRREQRCTKCGTVRWVSDVEPVVEQPAADAASAAAEDDPKAARAARIAARRAARAAAAAEGAEGAEGAADAASDAANAEEDPKAARAARIAARRAARAAAAEAAE